MTALLNQLRAWLFLPADKANHTVWGVVLYLIGSVGVALFGQPRAVSMIAGMSLAALVAVAWEAANHKVDPENPFSPGDVLAGLAGASLGLLASLPIR